MVQQPAQLVQFRTQLGHLGLRLLPNPPERLVVGGGFVLLAGLYLTFEFQLVTALPLRQQLVLLQLPSAQPGRPQARQQRGPQRGEDSQPQHPDVVTENQHDRGGQSKTRRAEPQQRRSISSRSRLGIDRVSHAANRTRSL
ncbi:hypothetical protein IL38_00090 [Actinopolyspora erythraea]|uniref:Uncharacterized protein n=1 Tax=Actinopolyspora erythraea TaxID=414996 RepID=A0ABR4X904_9ACTN|nr:hypothetical protein IL38_00090 [Actinopolyspora erythraea]